MSEFEGGAGEGPSEEEIAAFEEQLKRIRVEDVIVQTLVTLVNIGARRLGLTGEAESRDMDQARLAIEGARALMPIVPVEGLEPVRDALSQLQMAYAQEVQGGRPAAAGPAGEAPPEPAPAAPDTSAEDAERAKARSKLWTPPGT
ncbi:MAG: hypothetical protein QOJ07_2984 [Thermoleophilaceae bacterium]|nr:hypothetical protein [Thermoleophilaceae bacterium]